MDPCLKGQKEYVSFLESEAFRFRLRQLPPGASLRWRHEGTWLLYGPMTQDERVFLFEGHPPLWWTLRVSLATLGFLAAT